MPTPPPRIYVYWNLHKDCFSFRYKGLVYRHFNSLTYRTQILADCTFKVSEKGRQRVLKEKRKNVHAFIAAKCAMPPIFGVFKNFEKVAEVTYNPYKYATFVNKDTGEPIHEAKFVILEVIDNKPRIYVCER